MRLLGFGPWFILPYYVKVTKPTVNLSPSLNFTACNDIVLSTHWETEVQHKDGAFRGYQINKREVCRIAKEKQYEI
jgi:hypothetical protein